MPNVAFPSFNSKALLASLPALARRDPEFFLVARERCGDLYRLGNGNPPLIMLGHPRHAQHVLVDKGQNYTKDSPLWAPLRSLLGNGLIVSGGETWLRQRRMMQPQFHRQALVGMAVMMSEAIDDELQGWERSAQIGTPLSPTAPFNSLTMKVIVRTLFGGDIEREEIEAVSNDMVFVLDFILQGILAKSLPAWVPLPGRHRYQEILSRLDTILFKIIARGRARQKSAPHDARGNLLTLLLAATDEESGTGMSDQQLRDETLTLFLAGYETTSSALAWSWQFMLEQPAIAEKLRAEVDRVLGHRAPTVEDLHALPYSRMILCESLRLRPPSFWTPRVALAEDEIDGHHITPGTTVAPITYTIHHHPEFWDNPRRFDPERFTPARSEQRHRAAWIPFALGQHQCIGKEYAMIEGQLALINIVQRFIIGSGGGKPARPQLSATLRMQGGHSLRLARRPR